MYLDPGSGSIILQVIIATLLGLGVGLRMFWGKIKSLLGKNDPPADQDDSANDPEE